MKKLILILAAGLFALSSAYAGKDPVGVLFQVKGKVEYTKNGKKWKKVRRNKFLFAGYQVKTGPAGSGKVSIKETGKNHEIGPNALVNITKDGLVAQNGAISEVEASGRLMAGLMKKFSRSQSYTTVRRSHKKDKVKINSVRTLTLADEYPYMVWNNVGKEYHYRLTIGQKTYDVPATKNSVVKLKIDPFTGTKTYKISVLKNGNTVVDLKPYKSRGQQKEHTVTWLDGTAKLKLSKSIEDIQKTYGENSFMVGSYFEKQNMWVASMDQYRQYLEENPDDIEMTPYLFRVYKKLKLNDIYRKELEEWKQAMIE